MIQDKQIFTSILGFLAIENSVYDKQKNLFFAIFKGTLHLATFWKMSFRHPLGFWKIWYQRNQSQKLETSTKLQFSIFAVYGRNPAQRVSGLHRTDRTDYLKS